MKPIRVEVYYWDEEEARQAIDLEKAINACSHIPKEVKVIRKPHIERFRKDKGG